MTHSLLKDSEGNPISIVKTDVDVITIYATVFVTFDNSNPNLVYIGMPTSNSLVNYLIGGSTAPTGAFSLNDVFLVNAKLGTTSNASWTADTSNKQRKTNVLRFGTTVGNGQVKFLEFANVFSLEFPYNSVFNGQSYEGVSLGVGDGVKDTFDLPSANIKGEGLALKVNGLNNNQLVKEISLGRFRGIRDFETTFVDGTYHTSISGDGSKVITAGSASPYCFVFEKIGYSFVQVLSPLVTVPVTGCCISDDGLLIALSHSVTPFLSLFEWDGLSWNPKSVPTIVGSATCVSISTDKSVIAIGGASIRSYDYINSVLTPRPIPSQNITDGFHIKLNSDGTILAVTGRPSPFLYVYDWVGGVWVRRPNVPSPLADGGSGDGIGMSNDGIKVGMTSYMGSVFYIWNGSSWTKLTSPSFLGAPQCMTMSYDGLYCAIGTNNSSGSGMTHIFQWVGSSWVNMNVVASGGMPKDVCIPKNNSVVFFNCMNSSYNAPTRPRFFMGLPFTVIKFSTPPAIGDVITADYTVDGIHKTNQYVIDVSFAIQFGEGS